MAIRLFVSNLPWTIGKQQLKQYFSQFGRVASSSVNFDKSTGFSKGFGFVTFHNEEPVALVFACKDHEFEGRKLNIYPSESGAN